MALINGTSGADTLADTSGDDTINGLAGNDTINGGHGGNDVVNGGDGRDSLSFMTATSAVVVDFVAGTAGTTTFTNIEKVVTGDFNDRLTGNAAAQNLTAQRGDDTLWGAGGIDTLWGGAGADTFIFRETGTTNADALGDWTSGQDTLLLDGAVMTALGASGDFTAGDARFWASSTGVAHDADDRIIYNTTTRQVFYDADGNGSGAAQLIATLQSGATLVATDIAVEGGSSGEVGNGTSGNDSLTGTDGNDTIDGLAGQDTIHGLGGDDSLVGGDGNDVLDGGIGADTLDGSAGGDTLKGAGGNDVLLGGAGFDQFWITAADPDYGHDHVDGGTERDSMWFGGAKSAVVVDFRAGTFSGGGAGGTGGGTVVNVEGASGTDFNDRFVAADGVAAHFTGGGGSDTIIGGNANDDLSGDHNATAVPGDDLIDAGAGNDALWADDGDDTLLGGAGDDRFYLSNLSGGESYGHDSIDGGDGRDTIDFLNIGATPVVVDLGAGTLTGGSGWGGTGSATLTGIENFYGGENGASDRITGSSVANELRGGYGADTLNGAAGTDTLSGGVGSDNFLFSHSGPTNADLITDFTSGSEKVLFDPAAFANIGSAGNFVAGDARFWASTSGAAHDADDRVLYNTSTGALMYDADGNGSGAAQLVATLQGAPALTATDIVAGTEVANSPSYNVRTLRDTGPSDNRVDLVLMGDGYTVSQIETDYLDDVNALIAYMFDDSLLTGPFGRYESFFNIHAIDVISRESGADHFGESRDTALGASNPNGRSLTIDEALASRVLSDALEGTDIGAEMRLVPVNDTMYGGTGGPFATYAAGNGAALEIALHEAGHQFAHLGDQYVENNFHWSGQQEPMNPDLTSDSGGAKWSHWLGYQQPGVGTIGVYEGGGGGYATGIYRPSPISKMRALGYPFDAVGQEAFILKFYELVDPLDAYLANAAKLEDVDQLWVDTIDPDVVRVDWTINGTTYVDAGERISLSELGYSGGEFTVTARAYDPTEWVRAPDRSSLEQTVQWSVSNDGPGNGGHDSLSGTSGSDTIDGGPGNDTINGLGGNDSLIGGSGNDSLDGGDGTDTMNGGDGDDVYVVTAGDVLVDSSGSDTIVAGISWTLGTGFENLTLSGTAASSATGNSLANVLIGNAAANSMSGAAGNDTLAGGAGADRFVFTVAPGAANADRLDDFVSGSDKVVLDGSVHVSSGPSGNFAVGDPRFALNSSGTAQDTSDRVVYNTSTGQLWYDADGNGAGAAQLIATLQGAPGIAATDIEVINGSASGQVINGTSGADTLTDTAGNDTINGFAGNDTINGGSGGSDVVNGGDGRDSVQFRTATSAVVVDFVAGTVTGGGSGTTSFTNIEKVVTGDFNDLLTGNAAAQNLTAQRGSDTLAGAGGVDTLWGGAGADRFIFRETGTANADTIGDWTSGLDEFALDNAALTALGAEGDFVAGDARFWASSTGLAHDANDRVIYNTTSRGLYYDADGTGSGAAQLIATVQSGATVAATDIVVI